MAMRLRASWGSMWVGAVGAQGWAQTGCGWILVRTSCPAFGSGTAVERVAGQGMREDLMSAALRDLYTDSLRARAAEQATTLEELITDCRRDGRPIPASVVAAVNALWRWAACELTLVRGTVLG
jgi:hypothetical protein